MKVVWSDVEKLLLDEGTSQNEKNSLRLLFNSGIFQTLLLSEFGLITENSFFAKDQKKELAKVTGALNDLGSLDTYDLVDFIKSQQLTYQQSTTITPQQMSLLSDDDKQNVTKVLMTGLGGDHDPIRYSLSAIVQTGFPYRPIKGKQHFERKNGDLTVTMSAPNDIGLPTGMYPRLAFVYICSQIVKTQSRNVSLGPSLKKFVVDEIGRPWSTGKKGTATKWREAITSLLATSFTITEKYHEEGSKNEGIVLKNVSIASDANLWWDSEFSELKGAEIIVDESFSDTLLKHATPLDVRALKKLSELRSPLSFDLYCWLTFRFWKMEQFRSPIVRIKWDQLYGQLGTSIGTVRQFMYEARKALHEVKKVYPQANVNYDHNQYLILINSPPHVSPKRITEQQEFKLEQEQE